MEFPVKKVVDFLDTLCRTNLLIIFNRSPNSRQIKKCLFIHNGSFHNQALLNFVAIELPG